MSRPPTRTELLRVIVTLTSAAKCVYCGGELGETGTQTLDDVMRAITQHKATCPQWPAPRVRTAQCQPMAGQTAIPLPE